MLGGGKDAFLVLAMLLIGSYNTMNTKFQLQSCVPTYMAISTANADGCPEGSVKFNKPWLMNICMFIGEASLLVVYNSTRRTRAIRELERSQAAHEAARACGPAAEQSFLRQQGAKLPLYVFAIPSFCDVFGTGLAMVGMQYMDSAIWQMLRSSVIIFSAVCSVIFLGKKLQPFHWVATAIVFVGLILVGVASLLDAGGNTSNVSMSERMFGMFLVVAAQLAAAFQMVFEEKLLTQSKVRTSAKKVVGMEGAWGTLYMCILLLLMSFLPSPRAAYESAPEGLYMIAHSPGLIMLVLTYMCSIALYNLTGITVGKRMSAVVRCLVDSCRTVVVWTLNLFIYYFISEQFGTPWQAHAWLTLIGFAVLVFGTLLYNEVLPAPASLRLPESDQQAALDTTVLSALSFSDVLVKVDNTDEAEGVREDVEEAAGSTSAELPAR
eukprot:TRINITY_DN18149_c0_g1_i2.p1 TRINITY_DN18149_c0_g1~~TRINITY_DN18149_c0_g1_i2.p1  ORF type:complete len:437 (+),score=73.64 TRINITY_DN18149_c0_g1_i2:66-1376(+)